MASEASGLDALARHFLNFAERHLQAAPLYARLSRCIARDPELLALAAHGRAEPLPLLFLGAVRYLLLRGEDRHPLAASYADAADGVSSTTGGDPCPDFRDFCRRHRDALRDLIATRRVQTNEVRRCTALLPAFGRVAERAGGRPLALVEIGASAGLNLLWDRYRYDYGSGHVWGDPASPVVLTCTLRGGGGVPPLPVPFPAIATRVGIDLHPVDVRDPDAALWLRALIWPEHADRADRLDRALRLARNDPPVVVAGDALDLLPAVVSGLPAGAVPCVFHSYTVNQFPPEARERFTAILGDLGRRRDHLFDVSLEWLHTEHPALELAAWENGVETRTPLARCDAHGGWLEWTA